MGCQLPAARLPAGRGTHQDRVERKAARRSCPICVEVA
jgi:hypothetical protein